MSALGLCLMMLLAWGLSNNRRKIEWRAILGGLGLQFFFAYIVLCTELGKTFFDLTKDAVNAVMAMSDQGARFLFGDSLTGAGIFAFKVLPTIIFVSSLSYVLFYWGVIQKIVQSIAWVMKVAMNISAIEGLVTAANIFSGQTEAPLFVKPYLRSMTRSEIMTMMTGGMATVSGGIMAAYVSFGVSPGHLLAASIMSAPAAILISKLIHPETEESPTKGKIRVHLEIGDSNTFEAACTGASEGLKLALNVGAMLIAFIALVALVNLMVDRVGGVFGFHTTLENMLGVFFQPLSFLMGVSWEESAIIGRLFGERMVLNEFLAYIHLGSEIKAATLSERSVAIATYGLCGFANFSSIAIQIGGIGALEPSRKGDFAACGFKAMLGGTLACFMTACIAGILL
ncbi:MAG: NupC/NupG family nucleoside CNT transporter [Deltaproteobacteria bacterium]|nr:NupC/NupG family nucleoside CNT transporter [Deltaproteobacteria bacterium]